MYLFRVLSSPLGLFLFLLLLFLPLVNLFLFGLLFFSYLFLSWQSHTHHLNLTLTPDPFKSFFQEDDLCHKLEKHHVTLNLTINGKKWTMF